MGFYERIARPLLFRMDPEWIHERAMSAISRGLVSAPSFSDPRLEQELFGLRFPNPLGLGAGFDKNAVAVNHWHRLGFGHVELGTVTLHAQPGNPRPRLFRVPEASGLINRMGFNNDGAEAVASRLKSARSGVPFGINIGKSRVTPLESAINDYVGSFRLLAPLALWVTVNVSSPNTPGLRTLQERGPLTELLRALRQEGPSVPLFVKVAPDVELSFLDDVLAVALEVGLTGIVATNTTVERPGVSLKEEGGLSGRPLKAKADACLRHLGQAKTGLILIGVGGIFDGDDLYEKIALGAHLAQVYTGWVYGGPKMVAQCLRGLVGRMEEEGVKSLDELRGSLD